MVGNTIYEHLKLLPLYNKLYLKILCIYIISSRQNEYDYEEDNDDNDE